MKIILVIFFSFWVIGFNNLFAQSNSDCLGCHDDPELTMEKNGKTKSISFKVASFKKNAHKGLKCIQCHQNFNPEDIPHNPKIKPVNCMNCHKNVASKHLFHPSMTKAIGTEGTKDMNCDNCHRHHDPEFIKNPGSKFFITNLTEACGECHKKEKAEHLVSEHFHKSTENNPNTPNCIYCHTKAVTPGYKLSALKLKNNQQELCLSCHLDEKTVKTKFSKSLINFDKSVHGMALKKGIAEAASCTDCHGVHNLQKANKPTSIINKYNLASLCGKCHIALTNEFISSVHGIALKNGNTDAPSCTYCHGEHSIRPVEGLTDRVFLMNKINKVTVESNRMVYCVHCHSDEKLAKKYNMLPISKAHEWLPGIARHYETVRCVDCHSSYMPPNLSHNILPPEKTIKKCEECHSKNSILMTKLYKHERKISQEKFGFINGAILSDAYVIGTTRNVFLESLSIIILSGVIIILLLHALLRWYFSKGMK
jgi:predicted CXXCH cytochrome family protein